MLYVITLPEPITGTILGVQFVNGVGRTNAIMTASFFEKYKGATLSSPATVHENVATAMRALITSRKETE